MVNYVTERTVNHPINATSVWEGSPVRRVLPLCHRKDKPKNENKTKAKYKTVTRAGRLSLTSSQDQNIPPPRKCTLPDPSRCQSNIGLFNCPSVGPSATLLPPEIHLHGVLD